MKVCFQMFHESSKVSEFWKSFYQALKKLFIFYFYMILLYLFIFICVLLYFIVVLI